MPLVKHITEFEVTDLKDELDKLSPALAFSESSTPNFPTRNWQSSTISKWDKFLPHNKLHKVNKAEKNYLQQLLIPRKHSMVKIMEVGDDY